MRSAIASALLIAFATCLPGTTAAQQAMTDQQVRERMIAASIQSYSGNCPCPYNRASNGSRCGGRSAYSRPGGASPLCFPQDISDSMVESYRQRYGIERQ